MDLSLKLQSFNNIIEKWQAGGSSKEAATELTLEQVEALRDIVNNDKDWNKLLEIFRKGRSHDSWLAEEWPAGFDELVVCAPLCKYIDWECAGCFVGKRQNNFSCANDDSLFGYIAVLLQIENRELLKEHLEKIKNLLTNDNVKWDMDRHEIYIKNPVVT